MPSGRKAGAERQGETMWKRSQRLVYRRGNGMWVNKRAGAQSATGAHRTQRAAEAQAREGLLKEGGGELTILGENGRFRSKDTVGRRDPYPPRDREHQGKGGGQCLSTRAVLPATSDPGIGCIRNLRPSLMESSLRCRGALS
jgi:hypothetical protein